MSKKKAYKPTKIQLDRSYEAYKRQYKTRSSKNPDMYEKMLTKRQYRNAMIAAHNQGDTQNIARTIATKQRIWTYKFERSFYKETGIRVTGKEYRSYKQYQDLNNLDKNTILNTDDKYEYDIDDDSIKVLTKQTVFEHWYNMRKEEDPSLSHDEIEAEFLAIY